MYRAITGKMPPEAHDRMYDEELASPCSLGADIPERDERALLKALAFKYEDRWQSIAEFRAALTEPTKPEPVEKTVNVVEKTVNVGAETVYSEADDEFDVYDETSVIYSENKKSINGLLIALVAVIVIVVGVIAGFVLMNSGSENVDLGIEVEWDEYNKAKYDGITYEFDGKEVSVFNARGEIETADIVEKVNGYPVTSIDEIAFYECDNLKSITIPDSVTSIGDYAFDYCTSLENVIIPDSVKEIGRCVFYKCKNLTSVTIPTSVREIGYSAFSECKSLKSITIPDSVIYIGESSFEDCENLTSVTIPDSVESIGNYAFLHCDIDEVSVPEGCDIGVNAFDGNVKITYR